MINSPFKKDDLMKKINIVALALFSTIYAQAQNCPPASEKGLHVVQKGETLYGIARSYGMKVAQIVQLNSLNPDAILQPCTELKMTANTPASSTPMYMTERTNAVPVSYDSRPKVTTSKKSVPYVKTNESFHTVKSGETLDEIAEKYGYTTMRLMSMNNIDNEGGFYVGQDLRISDCPNPAPILNENFDSNFESNSNNTLSNNSNNTFIANEFNQASPSEMTQEEVPISYVQTPTASTSSATGAMSDGTGSPNFAYFNTSRFVPFYHIISPNESVESIARQYNLSPDDVMMMNNLKMSGYLQEGQKLMLEDRSKMSQGNYTSDNGQQLSATQPQQQYQQQYQPPIEQAQPQPEQPQYQPPTQPQYQPPVEQAQPQPSTPKQGDSNATSMSSEETDMANEINLVRSNPVAYIPYVEDYIKDLQKNGDNNAVQTAYELIAELRKTPKLSTLQPMQCLYVAARKHGNDQRKRGATDHQGSDGSWPWDRVLRECSDLKDGNENLVGGPANIRRAVILLLVDDGIEGRGHRKTTLNPDWKYVACHKMGTIGDMPNCWVQQYGF
jgi:LysM repeat protein